MLQKGSMFSEVTDKTLKINLGELLEVGMGKELVRCFHCLFLRTEIAS